MALPVVLLSLWAASPAAAQDEEPVEDSGGEEVLGTLSYTGAEGGERVPVPDVVITIETGDGEEVAEVTSDEEGSFRAELPGPGSYTARLDPETLPPGTSLRDADRAELAVEISPGQSRNLLFAIVEGEGGGGSEGGIDTDRIARLTVEGLKFGLIIAMCAIGLSLIFGTTGLVNFAHGELVAFGSLCAYFFNQTVGLHLIPSALITVVLAVLLGSSIERFFWRPARARGTSLTALLVVTIGTGLFVRYLYLYQFGGNRLSYVEYKIQRDGLDIGPVTLLPRDISIFVISIIALGLVAFCLLRTRMGKATRAVADNRDLAESSGIDVNRVVNVVWAAGVGLAALGGIFLGLTEQVSWQGGFQLLLLMFAAVTLGGLGTAFGALLGSIVVGLFVQLSTLFVAPELKNVGALMILIVILLIRPQGILGQSERVG
ncbi:MAG: ABC transporter permease subunit [Acidimicrobiales bacterium]